MYSRNNRLWLCSGVPRSHLGWNFGFVVIFFRPSSVRWESVYVRCLSSPSCELKKIIIPFESEIISAGIRVKKLCWGVLCRCWFTNWHIYFVCGMEDARQLSSRPLLHCTSVLLAVSGLMLIVAHILHWPSMDRLSWILAVAVLSHHLRDAARHGLWLYPFGCTPPIPYVGYIVSCMLLPHSVPWLVRSTQVMLQPATIHAVVILWAWLLQCNKWFSNALSLTTSTCLPSWMHCWYR